MNARRELVVDSTDDGAVSFAEALTTRPIFVAVIDDDKRHCRAGARLLRAASMEAISYASAEAFLDDAKQPCFACLLLDVQLGGMSGIELALWLAARAAGPPIIFLTAVED